MSDFERKVLMTSYEAYLDSLGRKLDFRDELRSIEKKVKRSKDSSHPLRSPHPSSHPLRRSSPHPHPPSQRRSSPHKRRSHSPVKRRREEGGEEEGMINERYSNFQTHVMFNDPVTEGEIKDWLAANNCGNGMIQIELHNNTGLRANLFFESKQDWETCTGLSNTRIGQTTVSRFCDFKPKYKR